MRNIVILRWSG